MHTCLTRPKHDKIEMWFLFFNLSEKVKKINENHVNKLIIFTKNEGFERLRQHFLGLRQHFLDRKTCPKKGNIFSNDSPIIFHQFFGQTAWWSPVRITFRQFWTMSTQFPNSFQKNQPHTASQAKPLQGK